MFLHVRYLIKEDRGRKGEGRGGEGRGGVKKEKIKKKGRQSYPFRHSYGDSIYTSHTWNTLAS